MTLQTNNPSSSISGKQSSTKHRATKQKASERASERANEAHRANCKVAPTRWAGVAECRVGHWRENAKSDNDTSPKKKTRPKRNTLREVTFGLMYSLRVPASQGALSLCSRTVEVDSTKDNIRFSQTSEHRLNNRCPKKPTPSTPLCPVTVGFFHLHHPQKGSLFRPATPTCAFRRKLLGHGNASFVSEIDYRTRLIRTSSFDPRQTKGECPLNPRTLPSEGNLTEFMSIHKCPPVIGSTKKTTPRGTNRKTRASVLVPKSAPPRSWARPLSVAAPRLVTAEQNKTATESRKTRKGRGGGGRERGGTCDCFFPMAKRRTHKVIVLPCSFLDWSLHHSSCPCQTRGHISITGSMTPSVEETPDQSTSCGVSTNPRHVIAW